MEEKVSPPSSRQTLSRLLLIDTAGEAVRLAFVDGERIRSAGRSRAARQDEEIWKLLRALQEKAGFRLEELDALAAVRGPGRFTGVRIGMTVASVLSQSLGKPAAGMTIFEALELEWGERLGSGESLLAVAPAIREELYWQGPQGGPRWSKLQELPGLLGGHGKLAVAGPAAGKAAAVLPHARVLSDRAPSLAALAALARRKLDGRPPGPVQVDMAPMYLKPASFERPAR